MGWSRVYTAEIVYPIIGKLARGLRAMHVMRDGDFRLYRYLNVALLMLTLSLLMCARSEWLNLPLLGVLLICIPQVIYIYSYANSDAWGVSCSVILLAQAGMLSDRHPKVWTGLRLGLFFLTMLLLTLS